jgi:hypothetical protein
VQYPTAAHDSDVKLPCVSPLIIISLPHGGGLKGLFEVADAVIVADKVLTISTATIMNDRFSR